MDAQARGEFFARWGAEALRLPRYMRPLPLLGGTGQRLGIMVPGRGLFLDADVSRLGITQRVPGVVDRSRWARALDELACDAGSVTSMAALMSAVKNRFPVVWQATDTYNFINAGQVLSIFGNEFALGGGGAAHGTAAPGAAPNQSKPGNMLFTAPKPVSGLTRFLVACSVQYQGTNSPIGWNMALVTDVCVEVGQIDLHAGTTVTVSSAALTRHTGGAGVVCTIYYERDANNAITTNPATLTFIYVNDAGGSSTVTTSIANAGIIQLATGDGTTNTPFIPLLSPDRGIRQITSLLSSSAMTGSNTAAFAAILHYPMYFAPSEQVIDYAMERDARADTFSTLVVLPVGSDSLGPCLSMMLWGAGVNSMTPVNVAFTFADG